MINIAERTSEILRAATFTACAVKLNNPGLPPKEYQAVAKVIEAAGGKWDRKEQAHVFPTEAAVQKLRDALAVGSIKKEKSERQIRQAFYTPRELAARVVELAEVSGASVLEPSAGGGALLRECLVAGARRVDCVEIDHQTAHRLLEQIAGHADPELAGVVCGDFLKCSPAGQIGTFDRVVMNPPFTKNQDVKHVAHALEFLRPGGRLVAIMGANTTRKAFKDLAVYVKTRGWGWKVEEVPAGAFKESGTNVATIILTVDKQEKALT